MGAAGQFDVQRHRLFGNSNEAHRRRRHLLLRGAAASSQGEANGQSGHKQTRHQYPQERSWIRMTIGEISHRHPKANKGPGTEKSGSLTYVQVRELEE